MARPSDPSSSPAIAAPPGSRGSLLLVEDNVEIQLVASRILTRFGYSVAVAGNGIEALEAMATREFDAVLMDGQMPKMGGCETTREIRRREGTERHTPVIAMTANAMDADREECFAAGMDDYLTKPIRPDVLATALARWVRTAEPLAAEASPDGAAVAAPIATTGGTPLDQERLTMLRDLDDGAGDLLAALVDEFTAEAERQVEALRTAVSRGDVRAVSHAAHKLKGSGSNLGATQLSHLAGRLEVDARSGSVDELSARVDAIAHEFEAARLALDAEILAA